MNPPPAWDRTGEDLTVETGERTDLCRDTLYGFRRDSGHALLVPVERDFTAHVGCDGDHQALYDQAGLMLRQDEAQWITAGIELSDRVANLSVVVTRRAPTGPRWRLVRIGPMACSPERAGFEARFTEFSYGPAITQALQDDSPASWPPDNSVTGRAAPLRTGAGAR